MDNTFTPEKEITAFVEALEANPEVTLVGMGDMGYSYAQQLTIKSVVRCSYAQYDHAVKVVYREKRKRKDSYAFFYTSYHHAKMPAVLKGHLPVKGGVLFNAPEATSVEGVQVQRARYTSCDPRNVTDVIDSLSDKLIFRPSKF